MKKNPSFKDYRYVGFFANKTVPAFKPLIYIVLSVADNNTNCHYRSEKGELKIWVHKIETTIRASTNYKGRCVWAFLGKKQAARSYCHNFFCTAYFSRKRTVSWRSDMKYTITFFLSEFKLNTLKAEVVIYFSSISHS